MKLDKYQQEIVDSNEPKILVSAGAGSGKTRTLVERVRRLLLDGVEPSNMVIITFTRMAGEELKERLADVPGVGDMFVGTIHSFANQIFKNSDETYKLFTNDIRDQFMNVLITLYAKRTNMMTYMRFKDLMKKVDAGQIDFGTLEQYFEPSEIYELKCFLGMISKHDYPEDMNTLCKKNNVITFDELLKKTTEYFKSINGKVEYLFVDEYQDIGKLEKDFFVALNAENYFYVGDEKQCQPEGTKITMGDLSTKNIEDLKIGDVVLSYDIKEGHYCFDNKKGNGKKVLDISEHYEDELIEIETENGFKSSYTKNHRCLARIHYEGNENKSVVYIMQNDKGQYRVGSTKLFTFNDRNFGLRNRMNTEKATMGWILDVYENEREAWIAEQICAYKYGIPQITWTYKNIKSNEEDIDNLYNQLGDLTPKVKLCLEYFGRNINYPIFTKNINKHFSKIHITEVNACNLFPEVMDIATPYRKEDGRFKHQYFQIKKVNVVKNKLKVYGLKIDKTETYVADGILTHNSIYGFKGGNLNYFTSLMNNKNWKTYHLNNNYRCGKKIIEIANTVISQANEVFPTETICMSGKQGIVAVDNKSKIEEYLKRIENYKEWFLLVRTNKDLYLMEQKMNELSIPYVSFKKGDMTLEEMRNCMEEDKIKLLTIHTSKGLESPNVLMWGNFPIKQKPYMRNEEELRVRYVGLTRAIDKLIVLN